MYCNRTAGRGSDVLASLSGALAGRAARVDRSANTSALLFCSMQTVFFSRAPAVFFRKRPFEAVSQEDIKVLFGGSDVVRVGGLAGIVRVRVGSLVTYYVYESSHKDRNAGVCVCVSCVCAVPTSITQHVFRNEPAFWPRAPASGLYLALHADLHEKNKNPSLFFPPFSEFGYGKRQHFFLPYLVIKSSTSQH